MPTAWWRRSSPRCRASAGSPSSPAIPRSPTRARQSMSARSGASLACLCAGGQRPPRRKTIADQRANSIDARSGAHLWADRFDGDSQDVFELQDRITESVVAAIEPTLHRRRSSDESAAARPGSTPTTSCCAPMRYAPNLPLKACSPRSAASTRRWRSSQTMRPQWLRRRLAARSAISRAGSQQDDTGRAGGREARLARRGARAK